MTSPVVTPTDGHGERGLALNGGRGKYNVSHHKGPQHFRVESF